MNDLLTKTAEFFLIPEAVLSTVFLMIFIGIFAFGVYRQRKCTEFLQAFDAEADENFKALATKMTPDMFIKKNLRKISVTEDLLEELPNVFVSIGIVATFLGLGVAIQGAAELLQTDKLELPKLTAVLGVIAFKFQTSVWGICFSIIFRNVIVERYFEFRRQLVDEITDRLYVLERENARTLIERQNELLVAQHKEILKANAAQNFALVERLTAFESAVHEDNLVANENLRYLAENFKEFVAVAQDFAKNEQAFAESVDAFAQRVKLFQEEFAELVRKEMADLKAINESLGRIHAEHIQKIHDEHAANIFYTTQELDKLHQKFYLDAGRFAEESRRTLDNLLDTTIGRVHDEYTREAHEIRDAINQVNTTLSTIENNVAAVNQEFTAEQKHFVDTWNIVTNRISETMADLVAASEKENERLNTLHAALENIAHDMQINSAENFNRTNALMKDTTDNFQTTTEILTELQGEFPKIFKSLMDEQKISNAANLAEISAQSQSMVNTAKILQENVSELAFNNQTAAEKLRDELIAVKTVLENLTAAVSAEGDDLKRVAERFSSTTKKYLPSVSEKKSESNTVDGRDES